MTRDDHPDRTVNRADSQELPDLFAGGNRRQEPEDPAAASVEALWDDHDQCWLLIETDETAHLDERYIRAGPDAVVPRHEWR